MILAIDPGKKTGVAVLGEGRPRSFSFTSPSPADIFATVRWATARAKSKGERLQLVTEDQFIQRGSKANPQSMLSIARQAERWIFCGLILGALVYQVAPSSWQGPMLKSVDGGGSTKARAKRLACRIWSRVDLGLAETVEVETSTLGHDQCDALVIGRWWSDLPPMARADYARA